MQRKQDDLPQHGRVRCAEAGSGIAPRGDGENERLECLAPVVNEVDAFTITG